MSINTPGGNEIRPPQPPSGDGGADERPGYPPQGQAERLAALQAGEAAAQTSDPGAALDAELAALDVGAESPSERATRLGGFVERHFRGEYSVENAVLAVEECTLFENDCRELFEEPNLELGDEDAADPGLRERIENFTTIAANDETIATRTGEVEDRETAVATNDAEIIPASETRRAELEAAHPNINVPATEAERAATLAAETARTNVLQDRDVAVSVETAGELQQEEGIAEDLYSVRELQANFNELKAEHGTIGALQMLLEGGNAVQSPEMRTIVRRAIGTAQALVSTIPGKEAELGRLLDQTGINLAAGSQVEAFASLFTAAEASDEFTDEEVEQLRAVVAGVDADIKTGTDFENAMNETVLDDDGNEVPAHTESEPLQFGVGLDGFTSDDGETQYMRATPEHGHAITLDVTNLSPEEKAVLSSYLDTWRMTEDAGESEWLLSLTQYDLRGQSIVDPIKLIEAAQVVNAIYGGFAGYNGEVLRGEQQVGMIRWQAQLRSPKGDAARSDRNTEMTASAMQGLGIQTEDGRLDLDMLRAFGDYSRDNWFSAPNYDAVQMHLAGLFPEKFENLNLLDAGLREGEDLAA